MSEPTQARRDELLMWIGRLWRGDWTGHVFDGRDGQRWIDTAVSGSAEECDSLGEELERIEQEY